MPYRKSAKPPESRFARMARILRYILVTDLLLPAARLRAAMVPAVSEPRHCCVCKCVVTVHDGSAADGALRNGVAIVKRQYVDAKGKAAWAFDPYCSAMCWEASPPLHVFPDGTAE